MSEKLYIHHWKAVCDFRDANRGVKFGIRPFQVEQFKGKINKLEVKKTQKGDFQRVKIIKNML